MQSLQSQLAGKPIGLAIWARDLVVGVDDVEVFLEMVRSGRGLRPLGPVPALEEWINWHRRPWRALGQVIDGLFPVEAGHYRTSVVLRKMLLEWQRLKRMSRDEIRQYIAALSPEQLQESCAAVTKLFQAVMSAKSTADFCMESSCLTADEQDSVMMSAAMQYVLLSSACLFFYGEPMHALYQRACQGIARDVEHLLRLDKLIVGDPCIAQQLGEAWRSNGALYGRIMKGLKNPPPRVSAKKLRAIVGALMLEVFEALKHPTGNTELKKLFDGAAPSGNDPHIAAGETQYMRYRRGKRHWSRLLATNKSRAQNVSALR